MPALSHVCVLKTDLVWTLLKYRAAETVVFHGSNGAVIFTKSVVSVYMNN